jgi:hypothetical protein
MALAVPAFGGKCRASHQLGMIDRHVTSCLGIVRADAFSRHQLSNAHGKHDEGKHTMMGTLIARMLCSPTWWC